MSKAKNRYTGITAIKGPDGLQYPITVSGPYASLSNEVERAYFSHYYYMMINYAVSMFEWINLPYEIPEKFIERTLCLEGFGSFYKLLDTPVFMRSLLQGPFDIYYEPKRLTLIAVNGFSKQVAREDCVLCYNNYLRQPTAFYLETYAARMAKAEAFIEVNFNTSKTPVIMKAQNRNQKLTLENAYAKFTGNSPVIIDTDNMDLSSQFEAINLNVPFLVPQVEQYKKQVWDDAMAFLGIRNVYSDKRERLVSAEADGNIQQIEMSRFTMLNARKAACEEINRKYGWDIDVQFRLITDYGNGLLGHALDDELIERSVEDADNNDDDGFGENP